MFSNFVFDIIFGYYFPLKTLKGSFFRFSCRHDIFAGKECPIALRLLPPRFSLHGRFAGTGATSGSPSESDSSTLLAGSLCFAFSIFSPFTSVASEGGLFALIGFFIFFILVLFVVLSGRSSFVLLPEVVFFAFFFAVAAVQDR